LIRLPTDLTRVIQQGGTVVVPSRQRAHAARLAYAAAELAEGHRVWTTPDVLSFDAWLTREVERYAASAGIGVPRLLSPAEEWFLWRQCAAEATGNLELVNRGALAEALRRASATAADYGIDLQSFAHAGLSATSDVEPTPGTETALLASVQHAVDERCQALGAATVASLANRLKQGAGRELGSEEILCSGFLTLSPRMRRLIGSPGARAEGSRVDGSVEPVVPTVVIASDELDELERIAQWCKGHVERDPDARILVAMPGAPGSRERLAALIRQAVDPAGWFGESATRTAASRARSDSLVVIEGGAPLARVPAVAHMLSTLSWLGGNAGDFEAISAWLRAPYWQTPGPVARARVDLWLRERERMHFNLHELVAALGSAPSGLGPIAREISTQINKATVALGQGAASPRDWSERFRAVLEVFDWPGERARSSGEQQTVVRFHELLDEFGQLASATRSITRDNAIQWFAELASRTAFRPADDDAVITISSMFAAPVVRYDAIWIAGLYAEAFPQPVQPDPFLPLAAQLAAGVPAASPAGRLAEARALLAAWREGTDELVLSAPARSEDLELLPSPLLAEWLETGGGAAEKAIWLPVRVHREGMLETLDDFVGPTWPMERPLPSGTRSLELQNQCPFRAYAELRLGSTPLDAPEPGVAADLRGQLLHAALQKLWQRLRDSQGLAAYSDAALEVLITKCVEEAADETVGRLPSNRPRANRANDAQGDLFGDSSRSPALSRECRRTIRLIRTLCALERERMPFRVESTEFDTKLTLLGAQLNIRIDRVDALEAGGRAILDYKSGKRKTTDWYGERPSHPQLLAYLAALGDDVVAMGTVNVTAREVRFDGIATTPELLPKLKGVEGPFGTAPDEAWPIRRKEWLTRVENLAGAFLAGRAAVDPKPGACDYCHVASICRIADQHEADEAESGNGDE
jgi:ATP-dependent helicase/nuclease subunit B